MDPVDTDIYISPKLQRKHLRGFGGYRGTSIYGANFVVGSCAQHRGSRVEERGEVRGVSWARSRGPPALGGVQGTSGLGPEVALPFQDGVLGSPGLGPGGCHTWAWTAETRGVLAIEVHMARTNQCIKWP